MATSEVGPDSDGSAYRPISVLSPIDSRAMFPRRIGLSRGAGGRAGALAVLLAGSIAGCCVAPPDARELLAVGYRTPEQAVSTFQVAVRADEPDLTRRCFSNDFLARNHVSSFAWRVFWEDWVKREPFLRKGIADARATGPAQIVGSRARIELESHGRRLRAVLVLDDFCELWQGGERVLDEPRPFDQTTGVQTDGNGTRHVFGRVAVPAGRDPAQLTELRFGREWKIDDFEILDEASKPDAKNRKDSIDGSP